MPCKVVQPGEQPLFHFGASVDEHLLIPELFDDCVGILVERIENLLDLLRGNRASRRWRINEYQRRYPVCMCSRVLDGDGGTHAVTHEHEGLELLDGNDRLDVLR